MERQAARPVSLKVIWGRRQRHSFQPVLGILTVPLFVLILQTVSKQAAIFLGHVVWGSPHPRMHRRMPLTVISGTNLAIMPGSRCTNCRIRSAACVTLSRSCARRVLWLSRFPLGSVLRSIDSAGTLIPLFADFTAVGSEEAPLRAGLRPPLKRPVRFSRKPLSQRCRTRGQGRNQ